MVTEYLYRDRKWQVLLSRYRLLANPSDFPGAVLTCVQKDRGRGSGDLPKKMSNLRWLKPHNDMNLEDV